jgi:hypothetical protein
MRCRELNSIWVRLDEHGNIEVRTSPTSDRDARLVFVPAIVCYCPKHGKSHVFYGWSEFLRKAVEWAKDCEALREVQHLFNVSKKFAESLVMKARPELPKRITPEAAREMLRFAEKHGVSLTEEQRARLTSVALG